jgi:hypothetical protein
MSVYKGSTADAARAVTFAKKRGQQQEEMQKTMEQMARETDRATSGWWHVTLFLLFHILFFSIIL